MKPMRTLNMLNEHKQDILKDLNVSMTLRRPQSDALSTFAEVVELMKWEKVPWLTQDERNTKIKDGQLVTPEQIADIDYQHRVELTAQLDRIRGKSFTITSFEREFPSICFALATGVGKTRLMAACIAYLHRVKKVNNFFVVAPNKTIYEKLKRDFNQSYLEKYVFSGLYDFITQPYIIDGDNFNNFNYSQLSIKSPQQSNVSIHIFNIAKLTHGRSANDELARVMRLHEVLGQSYFNFLRSLPDLCVMMDESHHYHAEQGFGVINDLNPIIGVEFTATPQIQTNRGKINFKNVVYEYSLAHALNDKMYVKEPVVWTRQDFDPSQYTPEQLDQKNLVDGIKMHMGTKTKLEEYALNNDKVVVKPFVLVVAKDIAHSRQIHDFLTSAEFSNGYYADKVLEINSKQGKVESDDNMDLLLGLESTNNKIEIVIHVDKLKEGWDVTNLYTIIPLRASASETLTEQTIGRGLRLPYGERTGVDEVDRLSIVSHDKYQAIVELANDPNSIVRRVYFIDPSLVSDIETPETELVELKSTYEVQTTSQNFINEIANLLSNSIPKETRIKVASYVTKSSANYLMDMSSYTKTYENVQSDTHYKDIISNQIIKETEHLFPDVIINRVEIRNITEKAIEYCIEALTGTVIPIPEVVIKLQSTSGYSFDEFTLDTNNMNYQPTDDTIIGRELSKDGKTLEFEDDDIELFYEPSGSVEQEIAYYITAKDNIDSSKCSNMIFSLISQAKNHFLSYLSPQDTEKVLRGYARAISEYIYTQMNEHFHDGDTKYTATEIRPFTRIEKSIGYKIKTDDIYDYNVTIRAGEIRQKVFKGFKKACHTLYKFDSLPELDFARVLEQDNDVLKWLRPAPKQFNLYWGKSNKKYEPDFVVETTDKIYLVEVKAENEISNDEVQEKARVGFEYCQTASEWTATHGGKAWEYALIPAGAIRLNSSFKYLIDTRSPLEIMFEDIKKKRG